MNRVAVELPVALDVSGVYAATGAEVLECIVDGGPGETSTNILDLDEIVQNVCRWKESHPGMTPYYLPCVNNHPMVLAVLMQLNVGFSCASREEMCTLIGMGVPPDRLWLAHPCNAPDAILYAQQNHVHRIACGSVQELAKVHQLYPTANIVLRIRVLPDQKFGCCPTYDAPELLGFARSSKISIVGVHVAIPQGQQAQECLTTLRRSLRAAKDIIDQAHQLGLIGLQEVMLSGTESVPPALLCRTLTDLELPAAHEFIVETGREVVESAVCLVTSVQSKRVIRHGGPSSNLIREIMYFVNDGRYGSFEWWKAIDKLPTVRRRTGTGSTLPTIGRSWPSSLWGPTCDSADMICERLELPELEVGDFLVFPAMGAFGVTVASRFNGFPIPKTVACARLESTRAMLGDHLITHLLNRADANGIESSAVLE